VSKSKLVIGTRGSALARWQAEHVAAELRRLHPGLVVELSIIVTEGDRFRSGPLPLAGKGLWVKDLERALLDGSVDLAVHSLKDVPAELAPGLSLAAFPSRADPRDAVVSRGGEPLFALPSGARVGTSSLRRVAQLKAVRPDLGTESLRGNVDTRLRKVAEGVVDAAILACAGLDRLGHAERIAERLAVDQMLPAIGQGALALEIRSEDEGVRGLVQPLSDPAAEATVAAERALLAGLGGGCRTPVAGHARLSDGRLTIRGLVARPDASQIISDATEGPVQAAASLGAELARRLLARGAAGILADLG
jgi:hydroxymethylbilane synthase